MTKAIALADGAGVLYAATTAGRLYALTLPPPGSRPADDGNNCSGLQCIYDATAGGTDTVLSFTAIAVAGDGSVLAGDVGGHAVLLPAGGGTAAVWRAHDIRLLAVWTPQETSAAAVFTASPRGSLRMWRLGPAGGGQTPTLHAEFICGGGEPVSALALAVISSGPEDGGDQAVVVAGGRKGGLHLFQYPGAASVMADGDHDPAAVRVAGVRGSGADEMALPALAAVVKPIASVRRGGRVTCLRWSVGGGGSEGGSGLEVLARDAYVVQYVVQQRAGVSGLALTSKAKVAGALPTAESLTDGHGSNGDRYVAGFSSVHFVLWNLSKAHQLAKLNCGGGRRPYAYGQRRGGTAAEASPWVVAFATANGGKLQVTPNPPTNLHISSNRWCVDTNS